MFLTVIVIATISCAKELVLPANQAKADQKTIVEFLENNKLVMLADKPANNIDWEIDVKNEGEIPLIDIAIKDTVNVGGIEYYYYYIEIEEGGSPEDGEVNDLIVVDFNEYLLDNSTVISTTINNTDARKLDLKTRISGIQEGLEHFFKGIVKADIEDYRAETDTPGRGILIFPSGLGYKDIGNDEIAPNQPLRVDLVLYNKEDYITE